MRRAAIAIGAVAILAAVNWGAFQNETLLRDGRLVLLELTPVDPRSLMQGDYMALRFVVANAARASIPGDEYADGAVVLQVNEHGVGEFVRMYAGEPLAQQEVLMSFRVRAGRLRFATDAYFFQEGTAGTYEAARYGGFRVSPSGKSLLTTLHDKDRVLLAPGGRS